MASLVLVVGLVGGTPSGPVQAQDGDGTTTVAPPSTGLLVPGDGTGGTTTSTTIVTEPVEPDPADDDGVSDETLVRLVIAGLVVVALLVGVLTWRYWVATRPATRPAARPGKGR
ncbi:MAG: hypothetical protein AB7L84_13480 [Acidimicrobiia bacterium]